MKRQYCTEYELILSRMSVLERQIMDRAGLWELRNGKWWDAGLLMYVLRCGCCRHVFLSKRADKVTCSEKCKKKRQRTLANKNLTGARHGLGF